MVDPPRTKLRIAWDGPVRRRLQRLGKRQRGERNDRDALARVHRLDRPLERVLDLLRSEIDHTRYAPAPCPRPADLGQAVGSLHGQLNLNSDGQPILRPAWPQ